MIEHFAAQFTEYLVINVTQWSSDQLINKMVPILRLMDHEHCLDWAEEDNSISRMITDWTMKNQQGGYVPKSIGALWMKFRQVRRLGNGNSLESTDYKTIILSII